jgi:spermidine synthase
MVVEVLGSRVIGPFFGVSLFVWTAMITVTLLALAIGYAVGGQLADRHPSPTLLFALVIAAGVLVAAVPWLKLPVLKVAQPLGLRLGALAASALLFGPALFLLGCVSPFVVRIAAREWGRLGRTVGLLYAASTAGSFVGTVATGFWIIATIGVTRAFHLAGLALVTLGAVYFLVFGRRAAAGPLRLLALLPLPLLALFPRPEAPAVTMADGTRAAVVHAEDSFYGSIRVVDYRHGESHHREMIIDGLVQGGIDLRSGLSVYEYPYLLQWLPTALRPGGTSCLVVGVGAGVVPAWYAARGVATDVVDIDPQVVAVARRFFGFAPAGAVHLDDARAWLAQPGRRYDYLILDVFSGDTTPGHLLSVEALRAARRRLHDDGVLAVNLVGAVRGDVRMTASVVATLRTVFGRVDLYPAFDPDAGEGWGNLVIVAYDGPERRVAPGLPERAHPLAEPALRRAWGRRLELPAAPGAIALSDDFNPLDVDDVDVKERVRRRILETTHPDILAGG